MDTRAVSRRWFKTVAAELSQLTEDAFLAQHPQPALILEPSGSVRPTAAVKGQLESTISEVLTAPQTFSRPTDVVHPDARVMWLEKSERNPFAGMVTLGRANNNDLILPNAAVSKMHAIFFPQGEVWTVEDRGSTNGTWVDGERLERGTKRELHDGSILRFGEVLSARFFLAASFHGFCRMVSGTGSE